MTPSPETPATLTAVDPIRVMLVDDSAVIRGFLTRFIESDTDIKVVTSVSNGKLALEAMERAYFDVIVLDIEMPVMDGMTALPLILKADPGIQVIMASTLTKQNAAVTLKALEMGAAECLAKPTSQELSGSTNFRDDLVQKVKTLGQLARKKRGGSDRRVVPSASRATTAPVAPKPTVGAAKTFSLRPDPGRFMPDVIAVGSSTGGPQALMHFFSGLKGPLKQPVFVTQHMPATFTAILAEHISKQSGLKCKEAAEGDVIEGGQIYLAPGNYHMLVKDSDGKKVITLNQDAPESFCRPAVDPMLRSIISAYGKKVLAVIFTGMGSDGLKSCQGLVEAGGVVLAQDEATSVVWGMPGAVAMAGICTQVLPLDSIAGTVRSYADRGGVS